MSTPEITATITAPPSRQVDRFTWERALDHADLPPRTVAVALAFATFADYDGGNVTVGVRKVSARSHLPESTVRKHLTVLRDSGWARRVRFGGDGGTSNSADVHELTVPALVPEQATAPAVEQLAPPAPPITVPPAPTRRHRSPVGTPRPPDGPTSAHPLAVVAHDQRSPVSEAPLASERTTAHQLAPTKPYQDSSKPEPAAEHVVEPAAVVAVEAEPRPGRPDPYRPQQPAPRCPLHSDVPPGEWVPDGCHDCALLGRAHRARHTDDARAEARARRCCTECNAFGLLLGLDGRLLDNGRGGGIRCAHPTVPDEVWAGEVSSAPPSPPPVEAPVEAPAAHRGRHRADDPPAPRPPGWRPSPHPRDLDWRVTA